MKHFCFGLLVTSVLAAGDFRIAFFDMEILVWLTYSFGYLGVGRS
jgi:hypothetical protein